MKTILPLGILLITPGAQEAVPQNIVEKAIIRHRTGDWGAVCEEDKRTNDHSVKHGMRVLSAYPIDETKPCLGYGDNCFWIITEADRSSTTILLPSEY